VIAEKKTICAVVAATDAGYMWRQLRAALRKDHARQAAIELRLDWLKDDGEIERFLRRLALQKPKAALIATCRRSEAGGRYRGSIGKQLIRIAEALRAGCRWYDLEIETIRQCPPEMRQVLPGEGKCLASAHFFNRFPRDLNRVMRELKETHSDGLKIAAQCDSLAAGLKILRLARSKRNVVAVPMGEVALPLRILSLREGSALSYAPVETPTAPGQVSLDEMENVYRAGRLNRATRVYGIIGSPVAHSLSPVMQNAAFRARRMNAVYLPFLVEALPDFLDAVGPLGIAGFGVTLPHKRAIMRHLYRCDPIAAQIGAVNTVAVRSGKLYGYNTDYLGVLRALESRMHLPGSRVLLVGAGGAAHGAAFALSQAGANVYVCARRRERAVELAKSVRGEAVDWNDLRRMSFDAIVNATPVGMHPSVAQSPLKERDLNCRLVFDMIYRPRVTRLLQLAARRGIETVFGIEMFVAQGIAQFEIWTGKRAPAGLMRHAALSALRRRKEHASSS
jgi:3-dehydroquinate dehydratase / shikimate dehydrogenase